MAPKVRIDTVSAAAQAGLHFDASEANVFARELLKVRARVFEIKFPELKAMRLIPRNTDVNETDEQYTYRVATEYGRVKLGTSYQGTAPRADVSMAEATPLNIRPITASYGYDFQEARVAARTGNQLPMRKANAARRAIAQEINRILTFGAAATEYGVAMAGLAALTGTHSYTVPNGALGTKTFETKTPDEIMTDLNGICSGVTTNSNDVEHVNTLLLPLSSFEYISNKRMGDGSDVSILKHFQGLHPEISVEGWHALEAAPAAEWTGKRMIAYDKSPDVLEALVPVEFEQFAPQMVNMETITNCHARLGGVVLYRPKAVSYGDGI